MQPISSRLSSTSQVFISLYNNRGLTSLWKSSLYAGNISSIKCGIVETFMEAVTHIPLPPAKNPGLSEATYYTIFNALQYVILYPFKLVLIRSIANLNENKPTGVFQLIKEIAVKEGFIGFYKGFLPAIIGFCSYTFASCYFRSLLITPDNTEKLYSKIYVRTAAQLIAQAIFYPFDTIVTYSMAIPQRSTSEIISILSTTGIHAFWSGFHVSVIRTIVNTVTTEMIISLKQHIIDEYFWMY